MSYQADIYQAIQSAAPVVALASNRIYPDVAPGNTATPFIVYQTVSGYGTTTHDGQRDHAHPLIQFSCWAKTKEQAVTLSARLRAAIEGFTLPGDSETFLTFSNESGNRDQETGLFGEILELRASCKTNNH